MLQMIAGVVVTGALAATAATYLTGVQEGAEVNSAAYVESANARFAEYNRMLPGVVEMPVEPVIKRSEVVTDIPMPPVELVQR